MSRWLLGIDVGGTFTDLCLWDGRRLRVAKTLSTPDDFVRGICDGLDLLGLPAEPGGGTAGGGCGTSTPPAASLNGAGPIEATPDPFDRVVIDLVHGSTVATNTLLERRGDRVAFVTNRGFGSLLHIGRQDRPELYTFDVRRPPGLVARDDCFGAPQRTGARGETIEPLDEAEVERILTRIANRGIGVVAVCLLFSYLNPADERRIVALAAARGLWACASADVLPEIREYERASTTAVNAYVAGAMRRYLGRLTPAARRRGIVNVRVMQSNGGQVGADAAAEHAVRTILSGPAGGVVGAMRAAGEVGIPRIISYDMGGTSTDVALCDGSLPVRTDSVVGGLPVAVPMLAIHTVGAGGGSIAAIDAGGALRVGPESAGADPGPACYGRGDLATVTDAHVVLGRIRPDRFLGGRMTLQPGRSLEALARLGERMNCDAVSAARAVVAVAGANMEHALSVVSARQGHDPADFHLVSFGGAGGLHACELAESLGLAGVIVAAHSGILSACGLILSDILLDFSETLPRSADGIDLVALRYAFGRLMDRANQAVIREGYDTDDSECERMVDLRYRGQAYELTVPIESLTDLSRLVAPFHLLHGQRYGFADESLPVEAVTARVRARIPTEKFRLTSNAPAPLKGEGRGEREPRTPSPLKGEGRGEGEPGTPSPLKGEGGGEGVSVGRARVWFDEPLDAALIDRHGLAVGQAVAGPALLLDDHSTTVLRPGWTALKSPAGHLLLTRQ